MIQSSRSRVKNSIKKLLFNYAPPEIIIALKHFRSGNNQAFPTKNIFVTDTAPTGPVLILSPHPDDEVIGLGGTLNMHLANKSDITVLYLTDGGAGLVGIEKTELVSIRRQEAESVGAEYQFNQIFWDKEDTRLVNDTETVLAMVELLAELQPTTVYLPSFFDHHFDHFSTNLILIEALKKIPLSQMTIFGYEIWDTMPFPNYIVDISAHFECKAEMISHYITPLKTTDFIKLCKHRHALHYLLYVDSVRAATEGYAEAFYRWDAETYQELFDNHLNILIENRSPLLPSYLRDTP